MSKLAIAFEPLEVQPHDALARAFKSAACS